jgi:hypothetical protein
MSVVVVAAIGVKWGRERVGWRCGAGMQRENGDGLLGNSPCCAKKDKKGE